MELIFDYALLRITVPRAWLKLISGTLYDFDTNKFRLEVKKQEASDAGIVTINAISHDTEKIAAGTTYARFIEMTNGWEIEFEDGQYSVLLMGSNNNLFDIAAGVLVQNQVQIIPGNSAGLIREDSESGLTAQDKIDIGEIIWNRILDTG